jgi:hypothetical protein
MLYLAIYHIFNHIWPYTKIHTVYLGNLQAACEAAGQNLATMYLLLYYHFAMECASTGRMVCVQWKQPPVVWSALSC